MTDTKTKGVMTALKGRKGFDSKKGVALLAIVAKLTAKRKASKESDTPAHEKAESFKKESMEDGAGGPGFDRAKSFVKNLIGKVTPTRTSTDELIERSGVPVVDSKQKMFDKATEVNDEMTKERSSSSSSSPLQKAKDNYYKNKIPKSK